MLARTAATIAICLGFVEFAYATPPDQHKLINVFISQNCKLDYYVPVVMEHGEAVALKQPSYVSWDPRRAKPMVYKDPRTFITFYVESDGRHLAAFDNTGTLLWVRNPFEDSGLCPYRTPRPVLVSIKAYEIRDMDKVTLVRLGGTLNSKYLGAEFDSSQRGWIDEKTGNFFWLGQN